MLTPTLVRLEFDPEGRFEDRPSMLAAERPTGKRFMVVCAGESEGEVILDTGRLRIVTRANEMPFCRLSLEVRWKDSRFEQSWRPGDRDYLNLGGSLRSLDRYSGAAARLDGVHPAGLDSPDSIGMHWIAWEQDETAPEREGEHPAPPSPRPERADWLEDARNRARAKHYPARFFNQCVEARSFPPGILSEAGYAVLNDSAGAVLENGEPVERTAMGAMDWYFFAYGEDYLSALRDFRLLSGPAPMPPSRALGVIFSRWPAFSPEEVEEMARCFREAGYPISTLIMDMEWHREGWGHWDVNEKLIPDLHRFFERCHELGMDVVFNDHPLDVREDDSHYEEYVARAGSRVKIREREYMGKRVRMASVDICDPAQRKAFVEVCHAGFLEAGLDYWWNDGSRGIMRQTSGQLVSNKTFFEETKRRGKRAMHLARYGGLGSHRYGAHFTGDAHSDFEVLRLQCECNIRAAGAGLGWISHDIGGFATSPQDLRPGPQGRELMDPLRYLRWLQFGVFSPVLRLHSAPGSGSRRPDDYDTVWDGACARWLRFRLALLPHLRTSAREFYESGLPVTRGLFLLHPGDRRALRFDEYYFGHGLLVAPVLSAAPEREVYLPECAGGWWAYDSVRRFEGGREHVVPAPPEEVPLFVPAGAILVLGNPGQPEGGHQERLLVDVYGGGNGTARLHEDDESSESPTGGRWCECVFETATAEDGLVVRGALGAGAPLGAERAWEFRFSLPFVPSQANWIVNGGKPVALVPEPLAGTGRWKVCPPVIGAGENWELHIR